jgi:hypothetical protein
VYTSKNYQRSIKAFGEFPVVCTSCGAALWDDKLQRAYSDWLAKLDKKKRDRFILQLGLSKNALQCLERMILEFPGSDRAKLLRAMVLFFTERVAARPEWSEMIEKMTKREVFVYLGQGTREIVKVHFSPFAMLDVHSWAELSNTKPREFAEGAIARIFSFYIENDPALHQFWEDHIRPDISLILKAA